MLQVKRSIDVCFVARGRALSSACTGPQAHGQRGVECLGLVMESAGRGAREQPLGMLGGNAWAPDDDRPVQLSLLSHLSNSLQLLEPLLQQGDGGVDADGSRVFPPHGSRQLQAE